jgi:hypothetical protein
MTTQKLSIPLLRFMYVFCRERTKRCKVAVMKGGVMPENEFIKYSEIANQLISKK